MTILYPFHPLIDNTETSATVINPFGQLFDNSQSESGWTLYKEILYAADGIPAETLNNFPKLIKISADADIANELSGGGGIKFTDSSGNNIAFGLYPSSDPTTGTIIARVRVTLDSTASVGDVICRIYYSSTNTTIESKQQVVNDTYSIFMPLEEDPTGSIFDWARNKNIGTSSGSMVSGDLVSGQVENALDFDGTDDYIGLDFNNTLNRNFTLEGWFKKTSTAARAIVSGGGGEWSLRSSNARRLEFLESNAALVLTGGTALNNDVWNHAAVTVSVDSTATVILYANGVADGSTTTTRTFNDGSDITAIGAEIISGNSFSEWIGQLDEIRVSKVARSANWLAYAVEDDSDNANTFSLGTEQGGTGLDTIGYSATTSWNIIQHIGNIEQIEWTLLENSGQITITSWDINNLSGKTSLINWDVLAVIGNNAPTLWNVLGLIGRSAELIWNISQNSGTSNSINWNIFVTVGNSSTNIWNILETIRNNQEFVWSLLQKSGQDTDVNWNILQEIGNISIVEWNVLSTVPTAGQVVSLIWNVQQKIGHEVDTDWSVLARIGNEKSINWQVTQTIGKSQNILWNILSVINNTQITNWNILQNIGKSEDVFWNTLQTIRQDSETTWNVLQNLSAAGNIVEINWQVRQLSGRDQENLWNVISGLEISNIYEFFLLIKKVEEMNLNINKTEEF